MGLNEQLDALRDGDIARAEWGVNNDVSGMFPTAVEGKVLRSGLAIFVGGALARNGHGGEGSGLLSVTILRPLLHPGDRVRITGAVSTVQEVDGDRVWLDDWFGGGWAKVTDCERLPAEPAPECPFPIGAKVRDKRDGIMFTVTGWTFAPGEWVVEGRNDGELLTYWRAPEHLELVPSEPTIEVGQWWADSAGTPHIVLRFEHNNTYAWMRSWHSAEGDRGARFDTMRATWTLLDGPPEPPVGAVVAVKHRFGRWRIAEHAGRPAWKVTETSGSDWRWDEVLDNCDASTLRVLDVLGTP